MKTTRIYTNDTLVKDGGSLSRYHETAELRAKGLQKLSTKELRQLKCLLEMDRP